MTPNKTEESKPKKPFTPENKLKITPKKTEEKKLLLKKLETGSSTNTTSSPVSRVSARASAVKGREAARKQQEQESIDESSDE